MLKYIYSNNSYEYQYFTYYWSHLLLELDKETLTPILFNIATEPLLIYVTKYHGIKLFDNKLHITTYADDSAILSNSENDM